jgi:hypothetical protein
MTYSFDHLPNNKTIAEVENKSDDTFNRTDLLKGGDFFQQLFPHRLDDGFMLINDKKGSGEVSQKTIDSYSESFWNIYKNGGCGPETHDAFKDLCKVLPDLETKSLNDVLKEASLNKHVNMDLIVQHLMEILQTDGFKRSEYKLGDNGRLKMVNEKTGTEVDITYKLDKTDREKSTLTATVKPKTKM